jgi:hypothetical protein
MNQETAMNGGNSGDYLWDGSGPADATMSRLEASLSGYRYAGKEPELVIGPRAELKFVEPGPKPVVRAVVSSRGRWMSIAAMITMAMVAGWISRPALGPWLKVEARSGMPLVGKQQSPDRLHVGQWLRTDDRSSAEIAVASLGTVSVRPNSKIRIKSTGEHEHRLEMPYGSIHAFITAPPRVFIVDTPAARAVDMGCEYTLDLDEHGSGILRVSLGHVLLEGPDGVTSDVPMWGGTCRIRRGVGPGTPYFDDASSMFVAALERVDFGEGEDRAGQLKVVLDEARERDALSLWHLLSRTKSDDRETVFARLSALKPLPERITKGSVMDLDRAALQAWFESMRPF